MVSITAGVLLLILSGVMISSYMEKKTAMENGYEQVLEPGRSSPIWKKK